MRSIWISLIIGVVIFAAAVKSDMPYCKKMTPHCDSPGFKKNCPEACGGEASGGGDGGGGGGGDEPEATTKKSATKQPTTKSPTTKKQNVQNSNCNKMQPCIPIEEANARFLQRCQAPNSGVAPGCHPHCRYDEDTPTMKKAFVGGPCKLDTLRAYLTCASNGKDNSECCRVQGVTAQKKTGVCDVFCFPTGPVWPQKGETMKYAPCVNVLSGIMNCHWYAEGAN